MPDTIRLHGIEVQARHGVLDHEKTSPQKFLIDIYVDVDLTQAGATDSLADTIDYGMVAQRAHDLARDNSFELIESLADKIAEAVLEDKRAIGVTVTVHKPQAPISVPFSDVAVVVRRGR